MKRSPVLLLLAACNTGGVVLTDKDDGTLLDDLGDITADRAPDRSEQRRASGA